MSDVAPLPETGAKFPRTRYQGSKAKLVDWLWGELAQLEFQTCLDAFGGTGSVAYRLKQAGKQVTYNDLLRFNYYIGQALIENNQATLTDRDVDWLLDRHNHLSYSRFVQDTFTDIYFTDEENTWIDQTVTNIRNLASGYKQSLAFFALAQACLSKRPYNLFHRKNLYMRLAEVNRSFGNKTTWEKPFAKAFRDFVKEVNASVFDNAQMNRALNLDALEVPGDYDLVYLDPPYLSHRGSGVDYRWFYHFLEGLTMIDHWSEQIDRGSSHRRLKPQASDWLDKKKIYQAFDRVFHRYRSSIVAVSYRSDGIPKVSELVGILKQYKQDVRIARYEKYQYALSKNSTTGEILLIGA